MKRYYLRVCIYVIIIGIIFFAEYGRSYWKPVFMKITGKRTNEQVRELYSEPVRSRLEPFFKNAKVSFPPQKMSLLAFKEEKILELWCYEVDKWIKVKEYSILAASGKAGPKLKEGDQQVPEGIYKIEYFNPNSSYHLSMKINYPNDFDLYWADKDKRSELGTNIFIHGKSISVGCLAIGDTAIEELYILANLVGKDNVEIIISPCVPQKDTFYQRAKSPEWVSFLYAEILQKLRAYHGR